MLRPPRRELKVASARDFATVLGVAGTAEMDTVCECLQAIQQEFFPQYSDEFDGAQYVPGMGKQKRGPAGPTTALAAEAAAEAASQAEGPNPATAASGGVGPSE